MYHTSVDRFLRIAHVVDCCAVRMGCFYFVIIENLQIAFYDSRSFEPSTFIE